MARRRAQAARLALLAGALTSGCRDRVEGPPLDPPRVIDVVVGDGPAARAHRLHLATGRLEPLAPAPSYPYGLTPDGGILLGVDDDVVLRAPDGRLVGLAVSPGLDWHPALHPDGRRLLFESSRAGFRDLFVTRLDAPRELTQLTRDPAGSFDGRWSPDGERICFSSSRHGQLDLFVMRADGSEKTRWTRHPGDAVRCAFSPGGERVAYVSARDGRDDVLLARGPELPQENLTKGLGPAGAAVRSFAWHPTEPRLLVTIGGEASAVWIVEGRARRQLTPPGASDADASWSPDGRAVLLVREGEAGGLYQIDPETGRGPRLHPDASMWRPRWRPETRSERL